jgi:hypothetical protein
MVQILVNRHFGEIHSDYPFNFFAKKKLVSENVKSKHKNNFIKTRPRSFGIIKHRS